MTDRLDISRYALLDEGERLRRLQALAVALSNRPIPRMQEKADPTAFELLVTLERIKLLKAEKEDKNDA